MFDDFERRRIETPEATINLVVGGSGPPVLLLHGFPETLAMWHRVSPQLARSFTVVATDLRGYGDSSKPETTPNHGPYSKRAMANDQIAVMQQLGFDRFAVVGHDRGARVAHRMALDYPKAVTKVSLMDILPTLYQYENFTKETAAAYFHWFLFIQPADLPERLIGGDPDYYLRRHIGRWPKGAPVLAEVAMAEYLRCFRDPATVHSAMEDYRAAATIDLEHDAADLDRKVRCPMLVLWGAEATIGRHYDVLAVWKERGVDVRGHPLPCGHYLPEERPEETLETLMAFLSG